MVQRRHVGAVRARRNVSAGLLLSSGDERAHRMPQGDLWECDGARGRFQLHEVRPGSLLRFARFGRADRAMRAWFLLYFGRRVEHSDRWRHWRVLQTRRVLPGGLVDELSMPGGIVQQSDGLARRQ